MTGCSNDAAPGLTNESEENNLAPILEVKDLTHIYSVGTPFQHAAIEHVSFQADAGEFIGMIGHTGSGKSTLIQHLNGLLKPTEGQILFTGATSGNPSR